MRDYDQLTIDTRDEFETESDALTRETIQAMRDMADRCGEKQDPIRNRFEAYGHAVVQLGRVSSALSAAAKAMKTFQGTLGMVNEPSINQMADVCTGMEDVALNAMAAAAELGRVRDDLYAAEKDFTDRLTPLEEIAGSGYEEAGCEPDGVKLVPDEGIAETMVIDEEGD